MSFTTHDLHFTMQTQALDHTTQGKRAMQSFKIRVPSLHYFHKIRFIPFILDIYYYNHFLKFWNTKYYFLCWYPINFNEFRSVWISRHLELLIQWTQFFFFAFYLASIFVVMLRLFLIFTPNNIFYVMVRTTLCFDRFGSFRISPYSKLCLWLNLFDIQSFSTILAWFKFLLNFIWS